MPVLRINGYTVPVAQGSLGIKPIEIGDRVKSYNGITLSQRSNHKRSISFTTTPLSEMEAEALKGLVRGVGEYWSFDGDANGNVSASEFPAYLYSSKGVRPLAVGGNVAQQTSSVKFGGGSLTPGKPLNYPLSVVTGLQDLTINVWASDVATPNPGAATHIFLTEDGSNNNKISLTRGASANSLIFTTKSNGGTLHTLTYATTPWDGAGNFHMVTAVIRRNPEGAEKLKYLYFDGTLVASATSGASATSAPTLANVTRVHIGDDSTSGSEWDKYLDDFMVVPYAATPDIISAWYGMGKAMSTLPKIYVDGDLIQDDLLTTEFIGHIGSSKYIYAGGETKQTLSITLEET